MKAPHMNDGIPEIWSAAELEAADGVLIEISVLQFRSCVMPVQFRHRLNLSSSGKAAMLLLIGSVTLQLLLFQLLWLLLLWFYCRRVCNIAALLLIAAVWSFVAVYCCYLGQQSSCPTQSGGCVQVHLLLSRGVALVTVAICLCSAVQGGGSSAVPSLCDEVHEDSSLPSVRSPFWFGSIVEPLIEQKITNPLGSEPGIDACPTSVSGDPLPVVHPVQLTMCSFILGMSSPSRNTSLGCNSVKTAMDDYSPPPYHRRKERSYCSVAAAAVQQPAVQQTAAIAFAAQDFGLFCCCYAPTACCHSCPAVLNRLCSKLLLLLLPPKILVYSVAVMLQLLAANGSSWLPSCAVKPGSPYAILIMFCYCFATSCAVKPGSPCAILIMFCYCQAVLVLPITSMSLL
ncbi:hypothetical protein RHGRI_034084 [Rhododendron griersonianum]|uniref:Uncharacterized protein n=1 Tax=Rhododendron griersonianum TaxID=479676 RepID=A0AAV6I326_9ERIC|nr:hypothetical protein RHGRI_034084 [Rhododendron griersonianum]